MTLGPRRLGRAFGRWLVIASLWTLASSCSSGCRRASSSSPPSTSGRKPVWDDAILVASGPAHRGPWQMNESDYRWVDDPTVDIAESGAVAVAWVDQTRKDIFFRRYNPSGRAEHETPARVSNNPATFSWLPRVLGARDDPDRLHVLWQEIVFSGGSHGGEIFFTRSRDGGRTFAEPLNLSNSKAGDGKGRLDAETWDNGSLDLARGPKSELYAAWTEYEGALWFRRSLDGGATFEQAVRIGGDHDAPARGPSIAVAKDGLIHVAWTVSDNRSADIHFATSMDGGERFGPPRVVASTDGHSDAPQIAADQGGNIHLVHAESGPGPSGRYHVRYSRLRLGAPAFEEPRRISAPADGGSESEGAHYPDIGVDREGRVYVLWERYLDEEEGRPRGLAFTFSVDGGSTFEPPTPIPGLSSHGFNGSQQGLLLKKLRVDDTGRIAVVNSTFRPDEASRIWLVRGRLEKR